MELPFVPFFCLLYFSYLFLKTMICFSGCLMSSAIQKLFCEVYSVLKCSFDKFVREKVVSPSYSSTILGPPPQFFLMIKTNYNKIRGQHLFTLQREITRKVIKFEPEPRRIMWLWSNRILRNINFIPFINSFNYHHNQNTELFYHATSNPWQPLIPSPLLV